MKAYILIEAEVGKLNDVARELRALPGVEAVDRTTGPYDIIVVLTGADLNAIGDFAAVDIRGISGILRTLTCMVVGATE